MAAANVITLTRIYRSSWAKTDFIKISSSFNASTTPWHAHIHYRSAITAVIACGTGDVGLAIAAASNAAIAIMAVGFVLPKHNLELCPLNIAI
jgi:hypothetical protein